MFYSTTEIPYLHRVFKSKEIQTWDMKSSVPTAQWFCKFLFVQDVLIQNTFTWMRKFKTELE